MDRKVKCTEKKVERAMYGKRCRGACVERKVERAMYEKESGGVSVERKVKCTEKKSKRGMYEKENWQRRWRRTCTERKVGHVQKGRWRELSIYGKEGRGCMYGKEGGGCLYGKSDRGCMYGKEDEGGHDVRKGRWRGCIILKGRWSVTI